jgi:hypothetical protein
MYPSPAPSKALDIDKLCTATGSGRVESAQNQAKNNFCATGDPVATTIADYQKLQNDVNSNPAIPFGDKKQPGRAAGPATDRGQLQKLGEGGQVVFQGYVLVARQEGAESVNCGKAVPDEAMLHDIHISLLESKDATMADECSSIVAEMIPHHRPDKWTQENVQKVAEAHVPVRVTGQRFFDSSHVTCSGGQKVRSNPKRTALWEIHPIYKFEVCPSGTLHGCGLDAAGPVGGWRGPVKYRILALDGGGTWALIEAKALIALYGPDVTGHEVLRDFDMVAANSGGSIVLGGLAENLALKDVLGLFEQPAMREAAFSPTHNFDYKVIHGLLKFGPKYDAAAKLVALENALPKAGRVALKDVAAGIRSTRSGESVHLLITAFDYDRKRGAFFRSAPASGPAWGTGSATGVTLAEAIHASTNAPVNYFDAPAKFPNHPRRYWDGAIAGCNNPILAAVTEAIVIGKKPADIVGLSLGTATVAVAASDKTGLESDLEKLATAMLDDPPDVATFLAHAMTGGATPSRMVRMNPLIGPIPVGDMTQDQLKALVGLDLDAIRQPQVDMISSYADLWLADIAPNQPIRMDGTTLAPELGQGKFSEARKAWEAIR